MTADLLTLEGHIKGVAGSAVVPVFGQHNVTNLMAAASLALVAGMSPQEIWKALPNCRSAWGRNQWVQLKSGARALFDGYNANPESMSAAIENSRLLLKSDTNANCFRRGLAVLGEMRELGDHSVSLHEEMGRTLRGAGFNEVVFIGPSYEAVKKGFGDGHGAITVFAPAYDAKIATNLRSKLKPGDYVLIKGSRGMSLEVFLQELEPVDFKTK